MKIAVTAWKFGTAGLGVELADQAEIAEAMGFDSFWLPENHFTGPAAIPSPLMLLAAIASRTSRIRLGSTSYLLPIRNPILAAEEVAVLDRLSGGRVILGIGRGFQDAMFKIFNIPTKQKRAIFRENLNTMISAWRGEPIERHDGQELFLSPLPVQQPYPPLWVAAFGPLAIKQAGQLGLPYIASPVESLTSLQTNIEQHRQHAAEAGHVEISTTPIMRTVFVTDDSKLERRVKESLKKESAARIRDNQASVEDWAIVGSRQYIDDKIAEYIERLGMNYLIARGRIQGIKDDQQIKSHEALLNLSNVS